LHRAKDGRPIPDQRALAKLCREALLSACPGSETALRGSLAAGTSDAYSDVDLAWVVPDGEVQEHAERLPDILGAVADVASLRSDPDFQRAEHRRLIFVRFAGLPLFWRLDLDLRAASHASGERVDAGDLGAQGTDWSLAESAAMNATAAIKALARGCADDADGLLRRVFERVAASDPGGAPAGRIAALADVAAARDPRLQSLALDVHAEIGRHLTRTEFTGQVGRTGAGEA
jgi:predicted nucleotidyltransferase